MDEVEPGNGYRVPGARAVAACLALYAVYWVFGVINPMFYRASFLLVTLALTFVLVPFRRSSQRTTPFDVTLAVLSVAALGWPLLDIGSFPYRAATPGIADVVFGTAAILLVLEATRRTVGWILPATAIAFLVYAYAGPMLELIGLGAFAHRGYYPERLIGTLYMTFDGVFGTPLDVATTYIILFSIFGAVLERSGAGKFFIDWSLALMRGARAGPGRAVLLAGLLLGMVSGSGVAVTVTLGAVAWPLLRSAGYPADTSGAMLSAAGIGAIMAPPAMGAAAFLIAEFLNIRYIDVVVMAIVPTLLYYFSALVMFEGESRRLIAKPIEMVAEPAGALLRRYWYHFVPLAAIIAMLALGFTAFRAVTYATMLSVALSFVRRESAFTSTKLVDTLANGTRAVLGVTATTATAGIIVGVVTLTGLGLRVSGIVVDAAGGNLALTVLFSAIAVWMLGLAVPVTASYIIAAVMVAPALTSVGISPLAAHMFIFYYAVLSEVTPPTALSPFAAAAITGGNPYRTMMLTWKYALPAFLVPLLFTLMPGGTGLLMKGPVGGVVGATAIAFGVVGVVAVVLSRRRRRAPA